MTGGVLCDSHRADGYVSLSAWKIVSATTRIEAAGRSPVLVRDLGVGNNGLLSSLALVWGKISEKDASQAAYDGSFVGCWSRELLRQGAF